jgi:SSS family solute:Na+ symporter
MTPLLWGLTIYILIQLGIGLFMVRQVRDEQDYLIAGRSVGLGMGVFSVFATWFGAESCVSASGKVYASGLVGATVDPLGYGACLFLMGLVFAIPLWRRRFLTVADLFRERYSVGVERFAVLLMVPTSLFWAAAQMRAFGQVFDAVSDMGVGRGVLLGAGVAIVYTASGGLRADVVTDLFQGAVIIIGLLVVTWFAVGESGGLVEALRGVDPERLRMRQAGDSVWGLMEAWAVPICGSVVAQELIARVISARSPEVARRASLFGGGLYVVVGAMPVLIGLLAFRLLPGLEEPEQVLPLMAKRYLGGVWEVIFLGGLVSAILSTVDSTLLAAAALVSHNVIAPMRGGMSDGAKVNLARLCVVAGGGVSAWLAMQSDSIHELVQSASSFGSSGIFVVVVLGLFTSWGGAVAAYFAMGVGALVWVVGTWVRPFEGVYLTSLGAAFGAYVLTEAVVGRFGGSRRRAL